jgi:hypothetical protein
MRDAGHEDDVNRFVGVCMRSAGMLCGQVGVVVMACLTVLVAGAADAQTGILHDLDRIVLELDTGQLFDTEEEADAARR